MLCLPPKRKCLSLGLGDLSGFEHQGRAVDAVGEFFLFVELSVHRPDERHAVGGDEVELGHDLAKTSVVS